jgi:S1-C subfamily serine protease
LVALALVGSTVGGGAVGAAATSRWLAQQPEQAASSQPAAPAGAQQPAPANAQQAAPANAQQAAPASAPAAPASSQPVSAQQATTETIAGRVFGAVSPGVVTLTVSGQTPIGPMQYGGGSGFVVDASGLILTNHHVVEGARSVTVRFSNGATREAQVLGTDRGNDLALVKVDLPANVPVLPLADSSQVQVGEVAVAVGSPFGLEQSVTQGIVSAVNRTWAPGNGRVRRNLLQTDTPLNPGNSGGPLLNARGEVIGINSMIESPVRGSVGVGFAVPINVAKQLMPRLEAGAKLEPVWLGIAGQELDATIAKDQGLSVQSGVLVMNVVPDSPAARAGLRGGQGANERIPRGGDVITAVDGQPVANVGQVTDRLTAKQPGETVKLTLLRDGREQQVDVTLQAWPAEAS